MLLMQAYAKLQLGDNQMATCKFMVGAQLENVVSPKFYEILESFNHHDPKVSVIKDHSGKHDAYVEYKV